MRYPILTGLLALTVAGSMTACDSFVEDVSPPIDRVQSDSLDQQSQVPFLITGVKEGFNDSYDVVSAYADLLSDVGQFNQAVQNSTFPTFGEIDRGEIPFDNNSVDNAYNAVNEYRFLADDLLRRTNETIEFSSDADGTEARQNATYAANFHGGIARYFLATYFSPDETSGGAPISDDRDNPSPVISAADLYAQADTKLAAAATDAPTDYARRVISTLRARIALFSGNRAQAATFAASGLVEGDAPYTGNYASTSPNNWWSEAGRGRTQISIADRFAAYDVEDDRTLVETAPPASSANPGPFYRQALYLTNSDPIPFVTWQENALILAEAALLQDNDPGTALGLVNAVRADRGLDALASVDQAALLEARDRELFTQGQRLVDQRRFGFFHLQGKYQYFPLTQTERNANPNL